MKKTATTTKNELNNHQENMMLERIKQLKKENELLKKEIAELKKSSR